MCPAPQLDVQDCRAACPRPRPFVVVEEDGINVWDVQQALQEGLLGSLASEEGGGGAGENQTVVEC